MTRSADPFNAQRNANRRSVYVAGLLTLAAATAVTQMRSRAALRQNRPLGRFIDADGVRLHVVEKGRGDPLVLLHGNSSFTADFLTSGLVDLAARKYRVLVFDRPGYGHSARLPGGRIDPELQAGIIHAALRRLGAERPIVLGHSWGTLVALAMALDFPGKIHGLVLEAGYLYPQPRLDLFLLSQLAMPVLGDAARHSFAPLVGRMFWKGLLRQLFAPQPVPRHFRQFPAWMVLRPEQMRTSADELAGLLEASARLSRRYRELGLPLVILSGRGDRLVDPRFHSERLHAELPRSEYRAYPEMGHMLHHLLPEEVMRAVDDLARRPTGR
ncbi:alpha/beta hydrolase [Chelativorans sp.]|uniref:alpha/beta fold hydrolase n=1 Tax=Chelativorans sp. TaxID=2203393 RepID=UPI002811EAC2|nr:alpha/beta hydrolase [Chelativorans sp.]